MLLSSCCVLLGSSSNRFISYLNSLIRNCGSSLLSLGDVFSGISLLVCKLSNFILSGLGISLGLLYHLLLSLDFVSGLGSLDLRLCLLRSFLSGIGLLNMILSSSSVLLSSSGNRIISERDGLIRSLSSSFLNFGQILGRLLIRKPSDCFLSSLGISLSLLYRCLLSLDFVSGLSCLDLRLCLLCGFLCGIGLLNMILSSSSVLLSSSSNRFGSKRDSLIRSLSSSLLSRSQILHCIICGSSRGVLSVGGRIFEVGGKSVGGGQTTESQRGNDSERGEARCAFHKKNPIENWEDI